MKTALRVEFHRRDPFVDGLWSARCRIDWCSQDGGSHQGHNDKDEGETRHGSNVILSWRLYCVCKDAVGFCDRCQFEDTR
jgi:peptide methionine sulfoxide reductase MsrB